MRTGKPVHVIARHFGSAFAVSVLLLGTQSHSVAQVSSWERLSSLQSGSNLTITSMNRGVIEGGLQEWTPAGLTILQKNNVVFVRKDDVRQVAVLRSRSRLSRVTRLALIGGAVGAGLFGAVCAGSGNCGASPAALGAGAAYLSVQAVLGMERFSPKHSDVVYVRDRPLPAEAQGGTGMKE